MPQHNANPSPPDVHCSLFTIRAASISGGWYTVQRLGVSKQVTPSTQHFKAQILSIGVHSLHLCVDVPFSGKCNCCSVEEVTAFTQFLGVDRVLREATLPRREQGTGVRAKSKHTPNQNTRLSTFYGRFLREKNKKTINYRLCRAHRRRLS